MKKIFLSVCVALLFITSSCSNKILYNSYLVNHRKYNMKQVFNYPSNVKFWSVQDSSTYQMIDTLKYRVTYSKLSK
jgi:hypothetical protein